MSDARRARDELGKLRAIKVAAEAVAERLEQRGWMPADCPENRMLRLALGLGPDPMAEVSVPYPSPDLDSAITEQDVSPGEQRPRQDSNLRPRD
jgi:hypothetical protein